MFTNAWILIGKCVYSLNGGGGIFYASEPNFEVFDQFIYCNKSPLGRGEYLGFIRLTPERPEPLIPLSKEVVISCLDNSV